MTVPIRIAYKLGSVQKMHFKNVYVQKLGLPMIYRASTWPIEWFELQNNVIGSRTARKGQLDILLA